MARLTLVGLFTLLSLSCGGNPPPVPTPPQTTGFDVILCRSVVVNNDCPRVAGRIKVFLDLNNFIEDGTDATGFAFFTVPVSLQTTDLLISAPGYVDLGVNGFHPAACAHNRCHNFEVLTAVPPPPPPLTTAGEHGRLAVVRGHIVQDTGSSWRGAGLSQFRLYQRFLDGEDITPLLDEAIGIGATYLRVFGMYDGGIGSFHPDTYPQYLDRLQSFFDLLATRGLRCEFVVFADTQRIMPEAPVQRAHLARISSIVEASWNALGELVNEYPQNGVDPAGFAQPGGFWSRGSALADGAPFTPPWTAITNHTGRQEDWPRRIGCRFLIDTLKVPCFEDEPMGAAEVNQPGHRSAIPDDFAYFAAVCGMQANACLFHSDAGVSSSLMGPITRASAVAFFDTLRFIPADAPMWPYQRGDMGSVEGFGNMPILHDDALELRSFCKGNGSTEWCVQVRTTREHPTPRDGWQVVEEPRKGLSRLVR